MTQLKSAPGQLMLDAAAAESDRHYAERLGFRGYLETWPMYGVNAPEYMTGHLGPIVPLDDVLQAWYGVENMKRREAEAADGRPKPRRRRRQGRRRARKSPQAIPARWQ